MFFNVGESRAYVEIDGLKMIFGNQCGPKITNENGAAIYAMEADDPLKFIELLREWVTVTVPAKCKEQFHSCVETSLLNWCCKECTSSMHQAPRDP